MPKINRGKNYPDTKHLELSPSHTQAGKNGHQILENI